MTYFARRTQLQRYLGKDFAFESIEIGEDAITFKEAVELVEKNLNDYLKEKKAQLKPKDVSVPFENVPRPKKVKPTPIVLTEINGMKVLKNE